MLILLEVNKGIVHTFQVIKISEKIGHIIPFIYFFFYRIRSMSFFLYVETAFFCIAWIIYVTIQKQKYIIYMCKKYHKYTNMKYKKGKQ